MRFDDGAADRQTHPGALRLGAEEGGKDLIGLPGGQPDPGVTDRDGKLTILRDARRDGQFSPEPLIASIPLSMRFIKTCCSCTRSAVTL